MKRLNLKEQREGFTREGPRRPRFWFQLDMWSDRDYDTALLIQELKSQRRFIPSIRDGLRLIDDLWHGKIDVLLELFPFVEDAILARLQRNSRELEDVKAMLLELMDQQSIGNPAPRITEKTQFETVAVTESSADNLDAMLDAFDDF